MLTKNFFKKICPRRIKFIYPANYSKAPKGKNGQSKEHCGFYASRPIFDYLAPSFFSILAHIRNIDFFSANRRIYV